MLLDDAGDLAHSPDFSIVSRPADFVKTANFRLFWLVCGKICHRMPVTFALLTEEIHDSL